MKFEITGIESLHRAVKKNLLDTITRIMKAAALPDHGISISLIDESTMMDLCHRFKGKRKVTDVLSFPTPEEERRFAHSKGFLGDIVICSEQAKRQALEYGHSLEEEIAVLCAHGLLHLCGYDHEISEEEASIQMQGEMYLLEMADLSPELSLIGRV